jgi:tetratricopeptide (TPR) repeat protein
MRDRPDRVSYAVATTNDLAARIWSSSATQQSFAIADELAANPNSIRWKRDITINDFDSDDFDESSGALAIYEESLTLRRRLAEIDPHNNQWQRDSAYFLGRIGDEYRKVDMKERAIAAYKESLTVWRHLAKIDRRNPQLQPNISECLDKLGDVRLGAADGKGALAAYEESLTIRRHLSKTPPCAPNKSLNVAGTLERSVTSLRQGRSGAIAAYEEMLSIECALVAIDGSNIEWQRNLSLSLERLGDVTLTVGDTVAAVAAYEQTVALRRRLAASDKTNIQWQKEVSASLEKINRLKDWAEDNIELQRDVSATLERLENTSLSVGTLLRKLSSIPKLIAVTRRQSRRYLRIGLASGGKLSTQIRACVQGFQRSAAIFRKFSSLIAAIRRQSRPHLRISSAIVSKLSAQVRASVRGLQRPAEIKGLKLKWLFPAPSRWVPVPNQNECIAAEAQHEGSTHGQSDVLVPIGKENTANNSLTASPSSTVDEPHDATSVEASMITGGHAPKMDIQPQVTKSQVKARSGKRRRRKRKRHGASPRLPANQKNDMVRAG